MAQKCDYVLFLNSINSVGQDEIFEQVLAYAMNLPHNYDKSKVKQHFEKAFEDGTLSITKDRLDLCIACIDRQMAMMGEQQEIVDKLLALKNNINEFFNTMNSVVQEKTPSSSEEDLSGKATSYKSYDQKATELQERLGKLEDRIGKYESTLNDKLFTLIINTVAILGIFVAVAFAGFGANTLFSNITFDASKDPYINTFYLSLTAFFAYNLLFLLFYCIFKIIERLSASAKVSLWKHCWAFILIDAIMLAITAYLFVKM